VVGWELMRWELTRLGEVALRLSTWAASMVVGSRLT
jgi:hypothetical protein